MNQTFQFEKVDQIYNLVSRKKKVKVQRRSISPKTIDKQITKNDQRKVSLEKQITNQYHQNQLA